MNRGEAFDKAWRLGINGDFSLYNEIVHTNYESINQGVKINRDVSKAVLAGIGKMDMYSPCRVIYENDDFVCLHRFSRVIDDEVFFSLMMTINYKDGKVITQETIREPLDEDPSEGRGGDRAVEEATQDGLHDRRRPANGGLHRLRRAGPRRLEQALQA